MDLARRWRGWRSQPRRRMREDSRRRAATRVRDGVSADLDVHRRLKPGASILLVISGVAIATAGVVTSEWGLVGTGAAVAAVGLAFLWLDGGS